MWMVLLVAAGLAVGLVACTYLPPVVIRWRQVTRMKRIFLGRIALTFDDGPDDTLTPALLDLLARYDAKASFFLVGFRADRHPEVCEQIVSAGHEVGCHGYWHRNLWKMWPWNGVRDTECAFQTMIRWMPSDAPYRPPFGRLTTWVWLALRRRGSRSVWWTHVLEDTFALLPDIDAVCRRILDLGGAVLLIHCCHKAPERREFVLKLTESLLRLAPKHGLEICPLFTTLRSDGYALPFGRSPRVKMTHG